MQNRPDDLLDSLNKYPIFEYEVIKAAKEIAFQIYKEWPGAAILTFSNSGVHACSYIFRYLNFKPSLLSIDPQELDQPMGSEIIKLQATNGRGDRPFIIIDDIIDTGKTMEKFKLSYDHAFFLVDKPGIHRQYTPERMFAPIVKPGPDYVVFPWEVV